MNDPAVRLRDELSALDRAYSRGHHGRWSAQRRSELIDLALVELFGRSPGVPGTALAAIGGYGRAEQCPHSDIDLLLVHDGRRPDAVAALTDALLYPLWDAGFAVGQAVRTVQECREVASERIDAATAMLDLRHLAGDPEVSAAAHDAVLEPIREDPGAFLAALREAAARRRERFGPATYLLEPELKEGAGGLRDVASVGWCRTALGRPLQELGLLRAREREALEAAAEFLTRVRSALHLETGRRTDRLPLDLQPAVARAMGFTDEPRLLAEDGLMRSVFEHTRQVAHASGAVLARYLDREEGAGADVTGADLDPAQVLAALATAAEAGERPGGALLDAVEDADVPPEVVWDEPTLEGFLRLLRAGDAGVDALEALDRADLLSRYLPPWADVRCRPQRDPYHRFTVDVHLTSALRAMGGILAGDEEDDPVAARAVASVDDRDALLLGALFHDIGKVGEGGHVPTGARIARALLERMGVAEPTRELAAFLVSEHLVLPDTATRRDLSDENLIVDVAARVGTPERLAALYLLARADAAATGPAAWTPWRRTLIRELVGKVQRAFERGEMGAELAERLAERIDVLRHRLQAEPEEEVEGFVLRMPRGYFLNVAPERVAAHFPVIVPDVGSRDVRSLAAPGTKPETYELLVVARDRPGLLSWIAGALALEGLSILSAQVFTTQDGVAVDLFEVEGAFEVEVDERRWRAFRSTLRGAIEGRISLERRVEEKRRFYPARGSAPVTVAVDNETSEFSTVIEVGAPDRIGLLYDITAELADLRLNVHLAKVTTYTGRVIDAFYVRDGLGRKITTPPQIEEVTTAIRGRLEGRLT
jgi:[protein-PII] uridylyltransferase